MRWLAIVLVALSACATHDVLHSERLVARTACTERGIGIYGRMDDVATCGAEVTSIGDGCYVATRREHQRLFECAANAPDGHVMCVEDRGVIQADQQPVFDTWWNGGVVSLRGEPFPTEVVPQRCRQRYRAWQIATLPPRRGLALLAAWEGTPSPVPDAVFASGETAISLARILSTDQRMSATVCPGVTAPTVTDFQPTYPARFEQRLRAEVARLLVANHAVPDHCARVTAFLLKH